jgi:UDP-N-acetyl-D-mannosaminuronate dehydrogenase
VKTLIIGMGEVGRAHFDILNRRYETWGYDIRGGWTPPNKPGTFLTNSDGSPRYKDFEVLHIATPFMDKFENMVANYAVEHETLKLISILTTVPPGTSRKVQEFTSVPTCHSTTRGLHPNLEQGLRNIPKHAGGDGSDKLAFYFDAAGIKCAYHATAETTEVAHLLMNLEYAVLLAFADESARVCRLYGVDFIEAVIAYKGSYNHGFAKLGHPKKARPILTPPNGRIGGHCLVQNAEMLAPLLEKAGVDAPLIGLIRERYGKP